MGLGEGEQSRKAGPRQRTPLVIFSPGTCRAWESGCGRRSHAGQRCLGLVHTCELPRAATQKTARPVHSDPAVWTPILNRPAGCRLQPQHAPASPERRWPVICLRLDDATTRWRTRVKHTPPADGALQCGRLSTSLALSAVGQRGRLGRSLRCNHAPRTAPHRLL